MKTIILVFCMTTCNHAFRCLSSYSILKDYIEGIFIYDTGLTKSEKFLIEAKFAKIPNLKVTFHKGFFDNNFGAMRNRALDLVHKKYYNNHRDVYTNKHVIFPDDSYSLNGFDMDMLDDSVNNPIDLYITKIKNGPYTYDTCRIFRLDKNIRFTNNYRNEYIDTTGLSYRVLPSVYFEDTSQDFKRTLTLNTRLKPEDFKDYFHAGNWYYLCGDYATAQDCYNKELEVNIIDKEQRFLCYCFLAIINQDIHYYIKATNEYPERAGEAYWYLYKVTDDVKYLIEAKKRPLGLYRLQCNESVYDLINKEPVLTG